MKGSVSTVPLGSEYQNFLYAPICQDNEGMTLSVLSALARRDLDPWQEAARLAQLPEETTVAQITLLIDSLPQKAVAVADKATIAGRLSVLLPRSTHVESSAFKAPTTDATSGQAIVALSLRFFLIYLFFTLMLNWLGAGLQTPPRSEATSNAHADRSSTPSTGLNNTQ